MTMIQLQTFPLTSNRSLSAQKPRKKRISTFFLLCPHNTPNCAQKVYSLLFQRSNHLLLRTPCTSDCVPTHLFDKPFNRIDRMKILGSMTSIIFFKRSLNKFFVKQQQYLLFTQNRHLKHSIQIIAYYLNIKMVFYFVSFCSISFFCCSNYSFSKIQVVGVTVYLESAVL